MKPLLFLCFLALAVQLPGQDTLRVPPTHAAYDSTLKLLLVQSSETGGAPPVSDVVVAAGGRFTYVVPPIALRFDSSYAAVTGSLDTVAVAFTPLPLIRIDSAEGINRDDRVAGHFTYGYGAESRTSPLGVRHRGNFSLRYPKKSLDLEFRDPADPEESADLAFPGMREDDDWVLDAIYNEPSRVNAYVAHKLWLDLHVLPHAAEEPEAKSGADVAFVELFLNGHYHGLYLLSEQVDRKQLKLKKYKDAVRGELYKSEDHTPATRFHGVPGSSPEGDDWAGWEVKHPDEDEVDWDKLRDIIRFVADSSDAVFMENAAMRFDLDNVVDYLLYVNGLFLTDNVTKNTFLARYDSLTPYFFAPWDLDGGLGNAYDATRRESATGWITNGAFERLNNLSPDNFNDRLCDRYEELRAGLLDPDSLRARVNTAMDQLTTSGAYRREAGRWPDLLNYSDEQRTFTNSFITDRMAYLDNYVCSITTPTVNVLAEAAEPLRVFPNPAHGHLQVTGADTDDGSPYTLYSAAGRLVGHGPLPRDGRITLQDLPGGLYFVRVGGRIGRVVVRAR
ncbi:CotH kinase family protein [Lewinella sp. IMCC34183]|uniref:CotH kinase family protein n=1 Tax=Lewinella sp. IMCC34183 TaxID=2248762 RepID=UPI000E22F29D|nr:CotH kinase family protein [Lewinella sp. IMCC34183]